MGLGGMNGRDEWGVCREGSSSRERWHGIERWRMVGMGGTKERGGRNDRWWLGEWNDKEGCERAGVGGGGGTVERGAGGWKEW